MKKRGLSFSAMKIIIALLVFGAFTAAPAAAQAYPTGKEFFPAVYGMILELYPNSRCIDVDFYNNSYTFTGITGYALLIPLSYDLKIQLKGGKIDLTYDKIYQKDLQTGNWAPIKSFGLIYSWKNASKAMSDKMIAIANDEAAYEKYKAEAMGNIYFVHAVMSKFTELAFKDFIENYAKGSLFKVSGKVSDVKENKTPINGEAYKYVVSMSFDNSSSSADVQLTKLPSVSCSYYTNQDSVIRLSKSTELEIHGTLAGAIKSGPYLFLTLVDAQ